MLPASTFGTGMNLGFPDVCLTPAGPAVVPVPYPNIAPKTMAMPFSTNVLVGKKPGLNVGSKVAMTTGDEPGVAHPMIKGPGSYTMCNPKVFVSKLPAASLACPTMGNTVNNALGLDAVPSQATVMYSLLAAPPEASRADRWARPMDLETALSLADDLAVGISESRMLEYGVGLIVIRRFSCALGSEVWTKIRDLVAEGMRGLIIDVSGCPGGDTKACLSLAGDFLPEGTVLAVLREADGDETPLKSVAREPYSMPVAIVIDNQTASAAEIFAGSLKANGRAVLVGKRTFGKGAVQRILGAETTGVCASIGEVSLPDGKRIEGVGISPDLPEESQDEARERAISCVLERCGG